ncbi:fungal specific transcription factor domain-containing protein [Aspergillus affinis]|uniref:fungal specific transcription factor domain-containing protein n=1 Tax=Aspergillus affinis TaxID=1070780 RepID=UPI0022FE1541|nr:fungal-specific transcription factor domain-containing protein [Aspergillus affinis]KAI9043848.1 fungal-specific transcription factor domain-containing protein [Aspergillus affinis]
MRLFQRSQYTPSLDKVQCLLLFGIYLQSTNHILRCWMTVGEAIRMAQSLGLYLDQHVPCNTVGYREYTRRTWHRCVWLDRVLSATLGRPGMIPKWLFNSIPFLSMIDDEFFETQLEGSEKRPDGNPYTLAFAGKAFELYQILDDILLEIYLTSKKEAGFEANLPNINYCQRSNPVSTERALDSTDTSLSEVMLSQCSRMCFLLAHELIDIFNSKLDPRAPNLSPLPSWWYSVLYVFTAATVILIERFLEGRDNSSKKSTTSRTWDAAMHVLESYSVIADSAKRGKAALKVLSESVSLGKTDNIWLWESFTEISGFSGRVQEFPFLTLMTSCGWDD